MRRSPRFAATRRKPPRNPSPAISGEAERRQLTVMFCDLVGSTALSTRHRSRGSARGDRRLSALRRRTVGRFAGFVAKYMGDGVLIYFGYPRGARGRCRAGGARRARRHRRGRQATTRKRLNVRLGIASGLVVVGDLIGAGAAQERGVVGETPNLAARLQALAEPSTLVIAEAHGGRSARCSISRISARRQLAGFAEPQHAWRVIGESGDGEPLRGLALGGDAARRARRGGRPAAPPLAAGEERRRTGGAGLRRAGNRQVTADGGAVRAHRNRAAYPPALFLLAASSGQRALPVHRPARTRRRVRARRQGRDKARQAGERCSGQRPRSAKSRCCAELLSLPGGERFPPLDLSPQRKKERPLRRCCASSKGLARTHRY